MAAHFTFPVRVYYEDTDAGGVVYYANYLKFAERARTEMLRSRGIDQIKLAEEEGILFVVRHVEADLKSPARLDDLLEVETTIERIGAASLEMRQELRRNGKDLVTVQVKVATISKEFKPVKLPTNIITALQS